MDKIGDHYAKQNPLAAGRQGLHVFLHVETKPNAQTKPGDRRGTIEKEKVLEVGD